MLYGPSHAPAFACSPATHVRFAAMQLPREWRAAMAIRVSAQRIRNGVAKAPRNRAGAGRRDTEDQHRHAERQNQNREQQTATAQAHRQCRADGADQGKAGVPASSESVTLHSWFMGRLSIRPKKGAAAASGRPVTIQCARHFTRTINSSGVLLVKRRSREPSS